MNLILVILILIDLEICILESRHRQPKLKLGYTPLLLVERDDLPGLQSKK